MKNRAIDFAFILFKCSPCKFLPRYQVFISLYLTVLKINVDWLKKEKKINISRAIVEIEMWEGFECNNYFLLEAGSNEKKTEFLTSWNLKYARDT